MIPTVSNIAKQLDITLDAQHTIFAYDLATYWQSTRHMDMTEKLMQDVVIAVRELAKHNDVHSFAEWVEYVNVECQ